METENLKKLIKLIDDSSLSFFEFADDKIKIKIKKEAQRKANINFDIVTQNICIPDKIVYEIHSQYVGIINFSDIKTHIPYIFLGKKIEIGDLLCVINHLNLPFEIYSDVSGIISAICVANNRIVDYGKLILKIEALS